MSTFKDAAPAYRCHKLVHALKIAKIDWDSPSVDTRVEFEGGAFIMATDKWIGRHRPEVGGYFVIYDRGTPSEYTSYSPKQQFEAGYRYEPDQPPAFFPLSTAELKVLEDSPECMEVLADYWDYQLSLCDAMGEKDCGEAAERRMRIFRALHDVAKIKQDEDENGPWMPMTEAQKQAWLEGFMLRDVYEQLCRDVPSGKHPQRISFLETMAVLLVQGEPLWMRQTGCHVEVRAGRALDVQFSVDAQGKLTAVTVTNSTGDWWNARLV